MATSSVYPGLITITSFGKIISFLGVSLWKWLHSFTYVVFYLVFGHFIYFQFFSTYGEIGPDWFGYTSVAMTIIVVILQLVAVIYSLTYKTKNKNKKIT